MIKAVFDWLRNVGKNRKTETKNIRNDETKSFPSVVGFVAMGFCLVLVLNGQLHSLI